VDEVSTGEYLAMARKVIEWKVEDEGRDKGKVFVLTAMPARQAFFWGLNVILTGMNCGSAIPAEVSSQGIAGLAVWGIAALEKIPPTLAQPFIEELLACVQIQPGKHSEVLRPVRDAADDIEEPKTYWDLLQKTYEMHVGPFIPASRSQAPGSAKKMRA
jgi:hypothetical protein